MTSAETPVLFACTQNSVRSVMAQALFETTYASPARQAVSCGVIEGPLDGFVVAVLAELGIDVTDHEAQVFDALSPDQFDLIISFSKEAEDKAGRWAQPGCRTLFWDVRPPVVSEHSRQETLDSYRQIRDEIDGLLAEFFGEKAQKLDLLQKKDQDCQALSSPYQGKKGYRFYGQRRRH